MDDNLIIRAARFAEKAHRGQVRKYTGLPYFVHPSRLAGMVAALPGSTPVMVAAAFLHDVVEDCGVDLSVIKEDFSPAVSSLVGELTNTSKIEYPKANRAARKKLDRDRIRGVSKEAKIIKLCDRIDNIRDMRGAEDDFLEVFCHESALLLRALHLTDLELESMLAEEIKNTCGKSPSELGV